MSTSTKVLLSIVVIAIVGALAVTQTGLLKGTFTIEDELFALQQEQESLYAEYDSFINERLAEFDPASPEYNSIAEEIQLEAEAIFGGALEEINHRIEMLFVEQDNMYDGEIINYDDKIETPGVAEVDLPGVRIENAPHLGDFKILNEKERCERIARWIANGTLSAQASGWSRQEIEDCRRKYPNIMNVKFPSPSAAATATASPGPSATSSGTQSSFATVSMQGTTPVASVQAGTSSTILDFTVIADRDVRLNNVQFAFKSANNIIDSNGPKYTDLKIVSGVTEVARGSIDPNGDVAFQWIPFKGSKGKYFVASKGTTKFEFRATPLASAIGDTLDSWVNIAAWDVSEDKNPNAILVQFTPGGSSFSTSASAVKITK